VGSIGCLVELYNWRRSPSNSFDNFCC
jgi:hypothetical protein